MFMQTFILKSTVQPRANQKQGGVEAPQTYQNKTPDLIHREPNNAHHLPQLTTLSQHLLHKAHLTNNIAAQTRPIKFRRCEQFELFLSQAAIVPGAK